MKYSITSRDNIFFIILRLVSYIFIFNAAVTLIFIQNISGAFLYFLLAILIYLLANFFDITNRLEIDHQHIYYFPNRQSHIKISWHDIDIINYGLGAGQFVIYFVDKNQKTLLYLNERQFTRGQLKEIFKNLKQLSPKHIKINDYNIYLNSK